MSLVSTYYKNILLGIQRGNHCGVFSNAKPYFLLAVISCIDENAITENNIILSEALIKKYNAIYKHYEPDNDVTPIGKPYFHLGAEPFYTICYKDGKTVQGYKRTPSLKFLKESIVNVKLDDDLWELLQDADIRHEFSDVIIKHFIE